MVRHIHRRYEGIKAEAAPSTLVSRDSVALAHAQEAQSHAAIADCLSATTTLWLSVYGVGAAVLMGLGAWFIDRARVTREAAAARRALLARAEQKQKRRARQGGVGLPGRAGATAAAPRLGAQHSRTRRVSRPGTPPAGHPGTDGGTEPSETAATVPSRAPVTGS